MQQKKNIIKDSFSKLSDYCKSEEYKGYDPYDGLQSTLFRKLPIIRNSRISRLVWIQAFKKLSVNIRPLVGIKKDYNPKALGLFLSGFVALYKINRDKDSLNKISFFVEKILASASEGYSGLCWGYNFDWESRAFYLPRYTPTIVVSVYVASALLDAYEVTSDERLLKAARSTCDFILKDLNRRYDRDGNFIFSYSKLDNSPVFNASLLGSKLLARVSSLTGEDLLMKEAEKSVRYVCNFQKPDGSWPYGELPFHQWIDNFHTGFNLECISDFIGYSGNQGYNPFLEKGFSYYINTFFTPDGVSKYYNNSTFPVDIHSPAQLIITVSKLGRFNETRNIVDKVLSWTIKNMQSENGYFYYQRRKYTANRISYMRWSQAWMFYSMSIYLLEIEINNLK